MLVGGASATKHDDLPTDRRGRVKWPRLWHDTSNTLHMTPLARLCIQYPPSSHYIQICTQQTATVKYFTLHQRAKALLPNVNIPGWLQKYIRLFSNDVFYAVIASDIPMSKRYKSFCRPTASRPPNTTSILSMAHVAWAARGVGVTKFMSIGWLQLLLTAYTNTHTTE